MPDSAWELPLDLTAEILSRIPVRTLVRFESVCNSWRRLIQSPSFISLHLNRSANLGDGARSLLVKHRCPATDKRLISLLSGDSLEMVSPVDIPRHMYSPNLKVVGSCNGLVCLSHDCFCNFGAPIFLWNPATRESRALPKFAISPENLRLPKARFHVAHGFGYHHAIDDYKVVRIAFEYSRNMACFRAELFALSEGLWREVPALPCRVYSPGCVVLNGVLYWLAYDCGSDGLMLILSFDLRDEVFRRVYLPDLGYRPDSYFMRLTVYERSLCLMAYKDGGRAQRWDLWVMYGGAGEESWTKRSSIGPIIHRPLACGANGEILVAKSDGTLAIYEASSETFGYLPIKVSPYSPDFHFYIESLVPATR
ncbi:hypothetical protein CRG98_016703 [Punica granatum]|uniref:F-box domain-containing protein n=1 Tax=Punica granatum TaxID=22663 RepID=A0A2I0K581_PUNGR|nr:hypothetical protein CRG98_016703 [Punica granatum]